MQQPAAADTDYKKGQSIVVRGVVFWSGQSRNPRTGQMEQRVGVKASGSGKGGSFYPVSDVVSSE